MRWLWLVAAVLALAGCSDAGDGETVRMTENMFEGGDRSVEAGTTLTFANEDDRTHQVAIHMIGDPVTTLKMNETVAAGADASYTFSDAGQYHVWCPLHGGMTSGMAIVVTVT